MRKISIVSVLAACALLMSADIKADNSDKIEYRRQQTILHKYKGGVSQKPRIPSNEFIMCYYSHRSIEFLFPQNVCEGVVVVSDCNSDVWSATVSCDNNVVELPEISGTFTIICECGDDGIFMGEISL